MSIYTLWLIGAWILGSGLVAYVCDNLGRRLGKKRLTLWGLRPRHTAMVVTVLTGVAIAGVTVALVSAAVPEARVALFAVQSLQQERTTLVHENSVARQHALESAARIAVASRELRVVERQRDRVGESLKSARLRLSSATRTRDRLVSVIDRLSAGVRQREGQLKDLNSRMTELKVALAAARDRIHDEQISVALSHRQLRETRSQIAAFRSSLRSLASSWEGQLAGYLRDKTVAERQTGLARQQLATTTARLESIASELRTRTAALRLLETRLTQLRSDEMALEHQIVGKQFELETVQRNLDRFASVAIQSARAIREAPLAFARGQEIARRVIYRPTDRDSVRIELRKLLDAADSRACQEGARPGPMQRSCMVLAPYEIGDFDRVHVWDEDEQVARFADRITGDGVDVVVRALAAGNSVKGEPVQAALDVSQNRLVFRRGAVISQRDVDGRMPDAQILGQLIAMVQLQVRDAGISAGMISPPSGNLGEVNWEQLVATARTIRKRKCPSEVRVVALTDTWSSDPLLVRFVLGS